MAELCRDPFHIVAWATKALDEVRREVWNAARRAGQKTVAKELKNARFALWKNPGDLTERQGAPVPASPRHRPRRPLAAVAPGPVGRRHTGQSIGGDGAAVSGHREPG